MMIRTGCLLLGLLLLNGCGLHRELRQHALDTAATAESLSAQSFMRHEDRAATARRIRLDPRHGWLDDPYVAQYDSLPVRQAIAAVVQGRAVFYDPDLAAINPEDEPRVSAVAGARTRRAHLDAIVRQVNWSYQPGSAESLHISGLETRVFNLTLPHSERSATIGRPAGGSDGDGQGVGYSHNANPWDELATGLESVLGEYRYALLPSAGSIAVTAPPDRMRRAASLIESFNRRAGRRVLVELELFLVDLSDSQHENLDWSFIRRAGSGDVLSLSSVSDGELRSGAPFSLQLGGLSDGRYTGSELIFRALSEQGTASVISRPRLICLNNQVSELRINRVTPYTRSVKYTERNSGNTTTLSPEIETAEVTGGITIYVLPSIHDDRVHMTLSANYTQVTRFLVQSLGGATAGSTSVRLPEYDDTHFTLPVALKNGETMVLAGNPRTISKSNDRRNLFLPLFGGRSAEKRRLETVMLITAHILDPS